MGRIARRRERTVTRIQYFGSVATLNIHRNCLVLDGAYRLGAGVSPSSQHGRTHLVMSPLVFMQRHIDGQLCVVESCECYATNGSTRAGHERLSSRSTCLDGE